MVRNTASILLIEDDIRISELIKKALDEEAFIITQAFDGIVGEELALNKDYELVITDILLPSKNGLEICKTLKNIKPYLPIIMLTALGTTDDKVEGFDSGADDYLVKPFEIRELVVRIRALLKRHEKLGNNFLLKCEDLEMNLQTKIVKRGNIEIKLTPKEFKLLEFFLKNQGRVIPRLEIAEKVWGTYFDTGTNFIDVYINYLRKKIDKGYNKKLLHTQSGMGFILKA
ncbi:response regulator transcription factor [Apibacter muscae]|uniref:response regulator transcription factor n=1 Tax=Apibacter muscae TaxID=2509004 RepID=UPI0011AD4EEA|nr:response regulator transcription factor [Apibacter muscae]TWP30305.1 response regulator transcription factor [Apibacter muscae]